MKVHACNLGLRETKANEPQVWGQSGLHASKTGEKEEYAPPDLIFPPVFYSWA